MKSPACIIKWLTAATLIFLISCTNEGNSTNLQSDRVYPPTLHPDRIMQNLADDPSTQIALAWRSGDKDPAQFVEVVLHSTGSDFHEGISTSDAKAYTVEFHGFEDLYYKATVNGLEPSTRYMMRVGSENHRSEWFDVQTAPNSFEPFTFFYVGDIQNDISPYAARIFRNMTTHFPDARFIMHAGDLVWSRGDDDTWGEWYDSGSWLFRKIPSIMATGNSDHHRWTLEPIDRRMVFPQWHSTFNLPQNGPENMENVTYYVDYPGIRLISLYSNFESIADDREIYITPDIQVTPEMAEAQTRWLEEVLANNSQPWTAVTYHHPVYTAREDRENEWLRNSWLPLFEEYGVDLVLQGHDHLYSRGHGPDSLQTADIPVYTISVAGPKMRDLDTNHTWYDVAHEGLQMYQAIHLDEDRLHYEAFNLNGEVVDSFEILRSADGAKTFKDGFND